MMDYYNTGVIQTAQKNNKKNRWCLILIKDAAFTKDGYAYAIIPINMFVITLTPCWPSFFHTIE